MTFDDLRYRDGTSSSWGLANSWDGAAEVQDMSLLRRRFGDVDCSSEVDLGDAIAVLEFGVGLRSPGSGCPLGPGQLDVAAGDLDFDGDSDLVDAHFLARCGTDPTNPFCPD